MVEAKLKVPEQIHKCFLSHGYTVEHYQKILLNGLCSELEDLTTEIADDIHDIVNDLYEIMREQNKKLLIA
ncbi:MAG: hypothetical protein H3Z52_06560 [archaeon]|nr:hypothetical protein [archaeon]